MIWRVILCWLLAAQPAWANVPPHAGVFTDFLPVLSAPRRTNARSPLGRTNVQYYDHRGLVGTNIDSLGQRTTFAYDARGRLTNCTDSIGQITNALTPYTFDACNRLTGAGGLTYVYGPGLLYEVDENGTTATMGTYHYDLRGSTVALTDSNGNVTDRMEYSAYRMTTFRAGTTDTPFLYFVAFIRLADPSRERTGWREAGTLPGRRITNIARRLFNELSPKVEKSIL